MNHLQNSEYENRIKNDINKSLHSNLDINHNNGSRSPRENDDNARRSRSKSIKVSSKHNYGYLDTPAYSCVYFSYPKEITEKEIKRTFEIYGRIEYIVIGNFGVSKTNVGIYVKYQKASEAANCIESLSNEYLSRFREPLQFFISSDHFEPTRQSRSEYYRMKHLFVRISKNVTKHDLSKIFGKYGEIENIHIITNHQTMNSRGIAYVSFYKEKNAAIAKENVNDSEIIIVQFSDPPNARSRIGNENRDTSGTNDSSSPRSKRKSSVDKHINGNKDNHGEEIQIDEDGDGDGDGDEDRDGYDVKHVHTNNKDNNRTTDSTIIHGNTKMIIDSNKKISEHRKNGILDEDHKNNNNTINKNDSYFKKQHNNNNNNNNNNNSTRNDINLDENENNIKKRKVSLISSNDDQLNQYENSQNNHHSRPNSSKNLNYYPNNK
jgi:hypothetical protein